MQTVLLSARPAGVVAFAAALFLGSVHAESRPPLDRLVDRCVLIVKCKVEIKDDIIKYRVVESWKGKYSPDLFYNEPPKGYLYSAGQDIKASRISNSKDGQEAIFFYTNNAISAVKKGKIHSDGHDDVLVVVNGKVVYALNSRFETIEDREVYTLEEFKKAILAVVKKEVEQKTKKDVPKEKAKGEKAAVDVPQKDSVRPKEQLWRRHVLFQREPPDGYPGKLVRPEPARPAVAKALAVAPDACVYAHGFMAGLAVTRTGQRPAMGFSI